MSIPLSLAIILIVVAAFAAFFFRPAFDKWVAKVNQKAS